MDLMIAMWQDDFYTVESLAAFSDRYGDLVRAIDNDWEQTTVLKAMLEIPYALPRAEDISPDAAMQKAKENASQMDGRKNNWHCAVIPFLTECIPVSNLSIGSASS